MLKNNKGISLASLVVTITILVLLVSTAVYNGLDTLNESRKTAFVQELQIIQGQVNIIYEQIRNGEIDYENYLEEYTITSDSDFEIIKNSSKFSNPNRKDFRLLSNRDDLLKIGVDGINSPFFINFKTAEVIAKNELSDKDKTYRSLKDFGYLQVSSTTANINTTIDSSGVIKLSVDYPAGSTNPKISYVSGGTEISSDYTGEVSVDNRTQVTVEFNINDKPEPIEQFENVTYRNLTSKGIHNSPKLSTGMTPVKLASDNTTWEETTESDLDWYDYEKNSFAHVRLNDGSIFMWIPRFTQSGSTYIFSKRIDDGITNSLFYDEVSGKELLGLWIAKYPSSQSEIAPYKIQSIPDSSNSSFIYELKNKIAHITDYTSVYGLYPSEATTFMIDETMNTSLQPILSIDSTNRIAISVF